MFDLPERGCEGDEDSDGDQWIAFRQFAHDSNIQWQDVVTPGLKITADESMFRYGKGDCFGGMPRVIKIRRKPKGIGCEAKTVADVPFGIMLGLELKEQRGNAQVGY